MLSRSSSFSRLRKDDPPSVASHCWLSLKAWGIAASAICLAYVCFFVLELPMNSFPNTVYEQVPARTDLDSSRVPEVCVIGNSEKESSAVRVHEMWAERFPTVFYVWGNPKEEEGDHKESGFAKKNLYVLRDGNRLSWTKGIEAAYEQLKVLFPGCEYIFTHDDDLYFAPNMRVAKTPRDQCEKGLAACNAATLLDVLARYRPAVASFPWKIGDQKFAAMGEVAAVFDQYEAAPLTGFDSGMVLYHRSISDFFIPYATKGEGGFFAEWTLPAHFLQMFANLVFEEHAIRINALHYNNTINLDNGPGKTLVKDGLVFTPQARHPYEYVRNAAYMSFLASGLRNVQQRWGRQLLPADVSLPEPGNGRLSYGGPWFIRRLNKVYEIRHEAVRHNSYVKSVFSQHPQLLQELVSNINYSFTINVFTMNRRASFERLWQAISNASTIDRPVQISIHLDLDPTMPEDDRNDYAEYLQTLQSAHGPVSVSVAMAQKGLKRSILGGWRPRSLDEYGIFLEDDIEVSPLFLEYADRMTRAYYYNPIEPGLNTRLIGISLYNMRFNEVLDDFVSVSNNDQPYISSLPESWGALYAAGPWSEFVKWVASFKGDPLIPDSYSNRWPHQRSWKKYMIRYNLEKNKYLIYPNLPGQLSMSTNHLEVGTNDRLGDIKAKRPMLDKFFVPLLRDRAEVQDPFAAPPLEKLHVYNVYHQRVPSVDELAAGINVTSFDSCTMILTVYDRVNTAFERVAYYANFTYLRRIVVVWNNIDRAPPELSTSRFGVPVHVLRMSRNSLNNRFYPHDVIDTDCIINMDDDWDMPHEHLAFAVDVWRGHFWDRLVGYAHLGRNHVRNELTSTSRWLYSPTVLFRSEMKHGMLPFYSIALPSGLVYHRKYLRMYTFQLPDAARALVDETMNCDDLLLNLMVANATQSAPVLIDVFAKALDLEGLWKRSSHFSVRSKCLDTLEDIFGGMPLRYTKTILRFDRTRIVPSKAKHMSMTRMPYKLKCDPNRIENMLCHLILS